jgi:hypothetical protein
MAKRRRLVEIRLKEVNTGEHMGRKQDPTFFFNLHHHHPHHTSTNSYCRTGWPRLNSGSVLRSTM